MSKVTDAAEEAAEKMSKLIAEKSNKAKRAHGGRTMTNSEGSEKTINQWLSERPEVVMSTMSTHYNLPKLAEEAALAYDRAARSMRGTKARTNFVYSDMPQGSSVTTIVSPDEPQNNLAAILLMSGQIRRGRCQHDVWLTRHASDNR